MANKNITADGTTTYNVNAGGRYVFRAAGDFGSGTITLKWSDGTNDVDVPDGALTADGALWYRAPSNTIKAVLASSTSPDIIIDNTPEVQQIFG